MAVEGFAVGSMLGRNGNYRCSLCCGKGGSPVSLRWKRWCSAAGRPFFDLIQAGKAPEKTAYSSPAQTHGDVLRTSWEEAAGRPRPAAGRRADGQRYR